MRSSLVRDLHASEWQGVIYVTGGGSLLLPSLLTVPGASASVLEAQVPYNDTALAELIGKLDSTVQIEVAGALGMKAFSRARALAGASQSIFGFGLTAALETSRSRRGANRAHMSVQTGSSTHRLSLELEKGRGREAEESLVSELALSLLLESLEVRTESTLEHSPTDALVAEYAEANEDLSRLVWGESARLCVAGSCEEPRALLPGAFNPMHAAHRAMQMHAEDLLGHQVAYELCVTNVDKPPLDFVEIERRVKTLEDHANLWLTSLPLFEQKAEAFPGVTFVVGVDTIKRIGQIRYYRSAEERNKSFERLTDLGTSFLVYGRDSGDGFVGLEQLGLPDPLASLCRGVPEHEFRLDVSSSAIREST